MTACDSGDTGLVIFVTQKAHLVIRMGHVITAIAPFYEMVKTAVRERLLSCR